MGNEGHAVDICDISNTVRLPELRVTALEIRTMEILREHRQPLSLLHASTEEIDDFGNRHGNHVDAEQTMVFQRIEFAHVQPNVAF